MSKYRTMEHTGGSCRFVGPGRFPPLVDIASRSAKLYIAKKRPKADTLRSIRKPSGLITAVDSPREFGGRLNRMHDSS